MRAAHWKASTIVTDQQLPFRFWLRTFSFLFCLLCILIICSSNNFTLFCYYSIEKKVQTNTQVDTVQFRSLLFSFFFFFYKHLKKKEIVNFNLFISFIILFLFLSCLYSISLSISEYLSFSLRTSMLEWDGAEKCI